MPDLNRPVVVITGASSGIGKALAFEFGRNGFAVSNQRPAGGPAGKNR